MIAFFPEYLPDWTDLPVELLEIIGSYCPESLVQLSACWDFFENVTKIEIEGVATANNRLAINQQVELPNLKFLKLIHVSKDLLDLFGEVKTLEELEITGKFKPGTSRTIGSIILAQETLKKRRVDCEVIFEGGASLSHLWSIKTKIQSPAVMNFFVIAPLLEHLEFGSTCWPIACLAFILFVELNNKNGIVEVGTRR